jgi:hypothetical protein
MSPMIGFLNNQLLASWKLSPTDEDQAGQKIMWAASRDGTTWETSNSDGTNVLFPSMNSTENPQVALFAEPFLLIGGRAYAAASPRQFCLYPDQYQDILLLRRVYTDNGVIGSFGPIFWGSPSIPIGFQEASARNNVTTVLAQDSVTQADIATLVPQPTAAALPCDRVSTTKCEACIAGCQNWSIPLNISSLENERSHFVVPGGGSGGLVVLDSEIVVFLCYFCNRQAV